MFHNEIIPDEKIYFKKTLAFPFNGGEKVLNTFKDNIFPVKVMGDDGREKTLPTPSKIRQRIYSLYQPKEITKKVYNNIMNSINI